MSEAPVPDAATLALQRTALRRALVAGDAGRLHLRFSAAVIDRYREPAALKRGIKLLRTRTVGRIELPQRWSFDVGIVTSDDGTGRAVEVHVPFSDFTDRLPPDEWPHWLEHAIGFPASENFLKMRLTQAACIDDGETQAWE